ncbi:MAG: BrnT family toxin [Alphaproteobacteria bacterium]|nr:BrnT family toxin [Alphaproteobacteria bacterium]
MRFDWDEAKREANLRKHGVDFAIVERFAFDDAAIGADLRRDYGEPREIALGRIEERVHVLVLTRRGDAIRVISLRRANAREVATYEAVKDEAQTHQSGGLGRG